MCSSWLGGYVGWGLYLEIVGGFEECGGLYWLGKGKCLLERVIVYFFLD